ncbi:MAG TPA: acyltransferase [Phycisphaerae bacterium]|nr:acyltransferase [Phycisphaerae bacterium]HOJ75901.1 acyltransferase [Phycisphaerae bacterium]HOM52323.1 acyltransferase [Phycisphaerae bacterium]HOQ84647.1 acyltransferase [Phycisphaerae bacterium]HPP24893.1 acyltransferase [Phycisphaerae bacterium]
MMGTPLTRESPDVSIEPPLQPRYRSLDAWRGLACLAVVIYHAASYVSDALGHPKTGIYRVMGHGYLGVAVFFVVSGYCIAAACDTHRRSARPGRVFILRRIRRIYPPFWIMLACMVVLILALGAFDPTLLQRRRSVFVDLSSLSVAQWIGNLTLSESWLCHLNQGRAKYVNVVTWSLCYEEQFYLICFVTLLLARRRFFPALAGITVVVTVVWLMSVAGGWQRYLRGTFLDIGWWEFAFGVGVYWRLNRVKDPTWVRRIDLAIYVAAAGLLLLFATQATPYQGPSWPFVNPWWGLTAALGVALILLRLRPFDDTLMNTRAGRALSAVGGFSYSLYLTHMPVCELTRTCMFRLGFWTPARGLYCVIPVSVLMSLVVGYVFYRCVERRFVNPPLSASESAAAVERRHREEGHERTETSQPVLAGQELALA